MLCKEQATSGTGSIKSVCLVSTPLGFLLGICLGFTVCCAMTMIMVGVPLVMEHVLHESDGTRMQAMQLHMLGMYLPMPLIPLLNSKMRCHAVFVFLALGLGFASCLLGLGHDAPPVAMVLLGIAVAFERSATTRALCCW